METSHMALDPESESEFAFEADSQSESQSTWNDLRDQTYFIFGFVGVLWLIELLDVIFHQNLQQLGGIRPRELTGFFGIPLAPFLHDNWGHLIANTIPFAALGGLVIISSSRQFFTGVTAIIVLVAGVGTWLFAKTGTSHIGASSLIFGFLGFLLWRAWLGRSLAWTLIAILACVLYGGIIISLFRTESGISWSGHFFGFVGGVIAAFVYHPKPKETTAEFFPDI